MIRRIATAATIACALAGALAAAPSPAAAAPYGRSNMSSNPETFSDRELVESGHHFFGGVSRGLALSIQEAFRRWGRPTGYILGQEGAGAVFGGLRYGEGVLHMRRQPKQPIYWQGPSLGFDVGGNGARTMMLVYNMRDMSDLEKRFVELEGSAYVIAGFGLTAATADDVILVPIRSGVGLRLGVNVGYIKFSPRPTWNPF
jgi:hypothetical protein